MIVGSGIDIVEIARVERALERRGDRFARRVFAEGEIHACRRAGRSALQFAVRFAAKEATMKALGTGWARGVRWVDIETTPGSDPSALALLLHGRVGELAAEIGGERAHLAVGRTRTHAYAVVLLESAGP